MPIVAPTPPPDTFPLAVEVVIKGSITSAAGDTSPIVQILHYGTNSPFAAAPNLPAFLVNFAAAMGPSIKAVRPAGVIVTAVTARDMTAPGAVPVNYGTPSDFSGSGLNTGDYQPPEVSAFVEKLMAWRYRGGRPGLHLSPVLESDTLAMRLSAGAITSYTAIAVAMMTALNSLAVGTQNLSPIVVSAKWSTVDPVTGALTIRGAFLTGTRLRLTLGSLQSRKVRGAY